MEPDVDLVTRLVAEQFPQWAGLPVRPVDRQGWDNRTFRLGDDLSVRLPSAPGYVPGLLRETQTLELLAPRLTIPVPDVVAMGSPAELFELPWSVRRWIDGVTLLDLPSGARPRAIDELAVAMRTLRAAPTEGAAWGGAGSAFRGCHPSAWGDDVQRRLSELPSSLATGLAGVWQRAMTTVWSAAPVWVHGDVAPGNAVFGPDGTLVALIDFGQACIGDPACDLAFAWMCCRPQERAGFLDSSGLGGETRQRGMAWALWKALIGSDEVFARTYGRERMAVLEELAGGSGQ